MRRRQSAEGAMGVEGNDWPKEQIVGISSCVSPLIFYFAIIQSQYVTPCQKEFRYVLVLVLL